MIRKNTTLCILLVTILCSCSRKESDQDETTDDSAATVVIHTTDPQQVIHSFGASDAWACQYIGLWPEAQRTQAADWLFSMEDNADGTPKGIGLSMWRFNIGAGSAALDNIGDEWRRAEGFLTDQGTYNWSKQPGQQWFMNAAKQRGVPQLLAFTNSPPVQLTRNGKSYSDDGEHANIAASNYTAFAVFLADVVAHFQEQGITINYLSPFNEPQWSWSDNGQEGSPYTNEEMYNITTRLDSVLTARTLPVKIQLAEAGQFNYLYELGNKPTRGNQIMDFFHDSSPYYLGNLTHVDKMISAHSYFTSAPMDTMMAVRKLVAEKIKEASIPIEFWQSEYCILGDQEEIPGAGKDTGMTTALYVARLIHHDLTVANACSWDWWTAISTYDYKDALLYADRNKTTGKVEDTKLLWALGNYSRFIRPGATRLTVSSEDMEVSNTKGLMISSYRQAADQQLVTVIVNYSNIDTPLRITVDGATEASSFTPYITAAQEDENLKPLPAVAIGEVVTIPKKSVVTLVSMD